MPLKPIRRPKRIDDPNSCPHALILVAEVHQRREDVLPKIVVSQLAVRECSHVSASVAQGHSVERGTEEALPRPQKPSCSPLPDIITFSFSTIKLGH